ncbi:DUF5655 domain-containing protein [Chloroflexota bacterium]
MKGGFAESPIRLNDGLSNLHVWTEQCIRDRGIRLADLTVDVRSNPNVEPAILEAYKPKTVKTTYGIGDHIHLSGGPIREVFESFRKQVLELDPVVKEEFLKLYVAYKAETNFVDVVPQAKRLRLSLNISFPEINDPKGVCHDVSGLGRWGNGDVEVGLATLDDLPYIMGLVRQAFEKQMGDDGSS